MSDSPRATSRRSRVYKRILIGPAHQAYRACAVRRGFLLFIHVASDVGEMAAFRPLVALLLLFLAAVVGAGRVKHVPLDREDDDFAEFDFDAEEEWDEG